MISKENYLKINKWNEGFFMYYEDLDFFINFPNKN